MNPYTVAKKAGMYATLPDPAGLPDANDQNGLSLVPQKQPLGGSGPWANLMKQEYLPEKQYGDNIQAMSSSLRDEYPDVHTTRDALNASLDGYAYKGPTPRILDTSKFPGSIPSGVRVFTADDPDNRHVDAVYMPSQEAINADPKLAAQTRAGKQNGLFGTMAHEARHVVARDVRENERDHDQLSKDVFGNQMEHFPGYVTDRDMANQLRRLQLSEQQSVPDYIRQASPWMGARGHQPTKEDLMQWIGSQPGYKP